MTCAATVTVTATPPPPAAPICTLTASPTSIQTGSSSTLSWTTANATSFSINNSIGAVTPVAAGSTSVTPSVTTTYTGTATGAGGTVTCAAAVTVTSSPPSGGGAYSGGGGGAYAPNITLAALPHVNVQPLAYLYLSQIPYTGLDLGPLGTVLYWIALIGFALALAYLVLFGAAPLVNRSLRNFGARVSDALNARELEPSFAMRSSAPVLREPHIVVPEVAVPEAPRGYSPYDGFKSFAQGGALSIDDIVKSLSHQHPVTAVEPKTEPVYEKVEPIYEQVEPIAATEPSSSTASVRGFASALVEGDREAVFAGLRQHVRGGGSVERLLSETVCLIDDVYRARIDGTPCDADMARLTARLNTPTIEKLVTSLTTAIDSSYSTGVTGAKLALTRALAILGA